MAAGAGEIDVDGVAVRITNRDKVFFPSTRCCRDQGRVDRLLPGRRMPGRTQRREDIQPHADRAAGPPDPPAALPGRHRRRADLPEAGARSTPLTSRFCTGSPSVGADRRRADGHAPVGHRPGAARWCDHPASLAGPLPRPPTTRRTAHRPGPATGDRVRRSRFIAVDVLKPLLDELGLVGCRRPPAVRGCTSSCRSERLGLRRGTPRRYRAGPRGGTPCARLRHHVVVEGGARGETVHRLQPECATAPSPRPTRCGGPPRSPRCHTTHMEQVASAATPDDYTMATVPDLVARRGDPMATDMDSLSQSIESLLEMADADAERGLGDLPYPPTIRRCRGSRKGSARRDQDLKETPVTGGDGPIYLPNCGAWSASWFDLDDGVPVS